MYRSATAACALILAAPVVAAAQPVQAPTLGALPPTVGGAGGGIAPGIAPTIGNTAIGGSLTPVPATPPAGGEPDAPGEGAGAKPDPNGPTKGDARAKLQSRGFKDVTDLHKDAKGVWHGKAVRNGQRMSVTLDGRGGVSGVGDSAAGR